MARSANRPVTFFNAVTLHGKFTFNSSQLTIKLIDIYNFCNVICFLKTGYFGNVWQQHGQLHLASAALHTAVPIRQFSLLKLILLTSKNRLVTSPNKRRKMLITMIDVSFKSVMKFQKDMKIKRKYVRTL
jgi:hypothetical protein